MPKGLNESLSWEAERVVQRDWTVACEGKWYQLDKCHEALESGRQESDRAATAGRERGNWSAAG